MALIDELGQAIKKLHGNKAEYIESSDVKEAYKGEIVWQGTVHTFRLKDHPEADTCYAWYSDNEGKRKYYAVLKVPPVDSPLAAVRASIVADYQ